MCNPPPPPYPKYPPRNNRHVYSSIHARMVHDCPGLACYDCETLTFQTHTHTHTQKHTHDQYTHTSLVPSVFGRGKYYDEYNTTVIFIVNSNQFQYAALCRILA